MVNLGDRAVGSTLTFDFNTHKADGTPIVLAGSPVLSIYKNSTTQSTTGITLYVDYDSITGLNHVVVDTSQDGTFYATANDFSVVITTGTVNSVSVVGAVVGRFSLGRANVSTMSSTALTGRDIGASVLLSTGTGTGQLSFTDGVVKSNMTQIDGLATSSNLATLYLKQLNVSNSAGSAILAASTGNNGAGMVFTGHGTGSAFYAIGGATDGAGVEVRCGGAGGSAMIVSGGGTFTPALSIAGSTYGAIGLSGAIGINIATTGNCVKAISSAGSAFYIQGGTTSHGLQIVGGAGATGDAINLLAMSTTGHGLKSAGSGTNGSGILLVRGGTGGFDFAGATPSSNFTSAGTINANVIQIDGAATNGNNAVLKLKGIDIENSADTTPCIDIRQYDVTGGGDAIKVRAMAGHGINIEAICTAGDYSYSALQLAGYLGGNAINCDGAVLITGSGGYNDNHALIIRGAQGTSGEHHGGAAMWLEGGAGYTTDDAGGEAVSIHGGPGNGTGAAGEAILLRTGPGATGDVINAVALSDSGSGFSFTGTGVGSGGHLRGGATSGAAGLKLSVASIAGYGALIAGITAGVRITGDIALDLYGYCSLQAAGGMSVTGGAVYRDAVRLTGFTSLGGGGVDDDGGHGLIVIGGDHYASGTAGCGVRVLSGDNGTGALITGDEGMTINGKYNGLSVNSLSGDGIYVNSSANNGVAIYGHAVGLYIDGDDIGMEIDSTTREGLKIVAGTEGLSINAGHNGMSIIAGYDGVYMAATLKGVDIVAGEEGIKIDGVDGGIIVNSSAGPGAEFTGGAISGVTYPGVSLVGGDGVASVNVAGGSGLVCTGGIGYGTGAAGKDIDSDPTDVLITPLTQPNIGTTPTATPLPSEVWLMNYMATVNKIKETNSSNIICNSEGTDIYSASLNDDDTTFTKSGYTGA